MSCHLPLLVWKMFQLYSCWLRKNDCPSPPRMNVLNIQQCRVVSSLAVCTLSQKHEAKGREQRADDQGGQRTPAGKDSGSHTGWPCCQHSWISSGCSYSSPHEGAGGTEKAKRSWVQWLMPLLKALGRLRQEHYYEFKASLY